MFEKPLNISSMAFSWFQIQEWWMYWWKMMITLCWEAVERPVPNWTNWQIKQALSEIQGGEARTQKPEHDLAKKLIQFPFLRISHPTRLFALHLLTIPGCAAKHQQAWQKDRSLKRGFLRGGTGWDQCPGAGGGGDQDLQSCFVQVIRLSCVLPSDTSSEPLCPARPSPGKVLRCSCNRGVEHKDTGELGIYCSVAQSRITKMCSANCTDHKTADFPSSSLPFECFPSSLHTNTLLWRHADNSNFKAITNLLGYSKLLL